VFASGFASDRHRSDARSSAIALWSYSQPNYMEKEPTGSSEYARPEFLAEPTWI
jgi:hypothetical protein